MPLLTLLAQASPTTSARPAGSGLTSLLFPVLLIGAMYFLMIRPQRSRMKAAQELIGSLEVGDEVQTAGGMFGRITRIDDEHAWVELAPGTTIKFLRRAIVGKVPPASAGTGDTQS